MRCGGGSAWCFLHGWGQAACPAGRARTLPAGVMRWLEAFRIALSIVWCGAALHLPVAVSAAIAAGHRPSPSRQHVRSMYLGVTTPAALLVLASAAAFSAPPDPEVPWLIAKTVALGLLAWAHGAYGFLLLKLERRQHRSLLRACKLLTGVTVVLVTAVAVVVIVVGASA